MAIALGLAPCPTAGCGTYDPSEDGLGGTILYKGDFAPAYDPSEPEAGLHQNFTVAISEYQPTGPSVISLAHFELTGVGAFDIRAAVGSECAAQVADMT